MHQLYIQLTYEGLSIVSQVVEAGVSDDQCVRMFVWVSVSPLSRMMMMMGACIADVSTFYIRILLLCNPLSKVI